MIKSILSVLLLSFCFLLHICFVSIQSKPYLHPMNLSTKIQLNRIIGEESAAQVANHFPTLKAILQNPAALEQEAGLLPSQASILLAALELAKCLSREVYEGKPLLDKPETVADLLREDFRAYGEERVEILLLDSRRQLIKRKQVCIGGLNSVEVDIRTVFAFALMAGAASLIMVHNHPSGDSSPSQSDIAFTRKLCQAGQLLKIEVADHVILGHRTESQLKDYYSLRENGLISF